jgi:hypothetical protein
MSNARYEYSAKVITPEFRGAFVRFFEPEITTDQATGKTKKTWGTTAIFPKGTDLSALKAAANEAAKKAWGDQAATKLKHPKFRSPFKDGATMVNKDGELYAGFEAGQITAKLSTSQGAPEVIDAAKQPVIDAGACKSGFYYRASVVAMAYDRADGMGISFKLQNVQKLREGETLGGGAKTAASDEFEAVTTADGGAPANADDLFN